MAMRVNTWYHLTSLLKYPVIFHLSQNRIQSSYSTLAPWYYCYHPLNILSTLKLLILLFFIFKGHPLIFSSLILSILPNLCSNVTLTDRPSLNTLWKIGVPAFFMDLFAAFLLFIELISWHIMYLFGSLLSAFPYQIINSMMVGILFCSFCPEQDLMHSNNRKYILNEWMNMDSN